MAFPPTICSLTIARTFFATLILRIFRIPGPTGLIFLTCSKPNSVGVSRPKIDTITLSLLCSILTSDTSPVKSASGPLITRT